MCRCFVAFDHLVQQRVLSPPPSPPSLPFLRMMHDLGANYDYECFLIKV